MDDIKNVTNKNQILFHHTQPRNFELKTLSDRNGLRSCALIKIDSILLWRLSNRPTQKYKQNKNREITTAARLIAAVVKKPETWPTGEFITRFIHVRTLRYPGILFSQTQMFI